MAKLAKMYSQKQIDEIRNNLILKYGNKCWFCQKPREEFKNNLGVDHNHNSGAIRGLLCFYCNKRVVGRHDIISSKRLHEYMTEFETNPIIIPSNKKEKKKKKKS